MWGLWRWSEDAREPLRAVCGTWVCAQSVPALCHLCLFLGGHFHGFGRPAEPFNICSQQGWLVHVMLALSKRLCLKCPLAQLRCWSDLVSCVSQAQPSLWAASRLFFFFLCTSPCTLSCFFKNSVALSISLGKSRFSLDGGLQAARGFSLIQHTFLFGKLLQSFCFVSYWNSCFDLMTQGTSLRCLTIMEFRSLKPIGTEFNARVFKNGSIRVYVPHKHM